MRLYRIVDGNEKSSVVYPSSFTKEDWVQIATNVRKEMQDAGLVTPDSHWYNSGRDAEYLDPYRQVHAGYVMGQGRGLGGADNKFVDAYREIWAQETQKQIFIRMKQKKITPEQTETMQWNRATMQECTWSLIPWIVEGDKEGGLDLRGPVPAYYSARDVETARYQYRGFYFAPDAETAFRTMGMSETYDIPAPNYLKEYGWAAGEGALIGFGAGKVAEVGVSTSKKMMSKTFLQKFGGMFKKASNGTLKFASEHKGIIALGAAGLFLMRSCDGPMTQEEREAFIITGDAMMGRDGDPNTPDLVAENRSPEGLEVTKNQVEEINKEAQERKENGGKTAPVATVESKPSPLDNLLDKIEECHKVSGSYNDNSPLDKGFKELKEAAKAGRLAVDNYGCLYAIPQKGRERNAALQSYFMTHLGINEGLKREYNRCQQKQTSPQTSTTGKVKTVVASHSENAMPSPSLTRTMAKAAPSQKGTKSKTENKTSMV